MSKLKRMRELLTAAKELAEDEKHFDVLLYLIAMAIIEVEEKTLKEHDGESQSSGSTQPN